MMNSSSITIKIPIYGDLIKITLTSNIAEYCKENYLEDQKSTLQGCVYDLTSYEHDIDYEVIFQDERANERNLVHETFHIVARIMRGLSVQLDENSEEIYAYLLDYLYNRIRTETIKLKITRNGDNDTSEKIQSPASRS